MMRRRNHSGKQMLRAPAFIAFWMAIAATAAGGLQAAGPRQQPSEAAQPSAATARALLDRYCIACHNDAPARAGRHSDLAAEG